MGLEDLEKLAHSLGEQPMRIPDVFLGELVSVDGRFEGCELSNGRPGIRFVFWPSIFPMVKFSIPFEVPGFEAFLESGTEALELRKQELEETSAA